MKIIRILLFLALLSLNPVSAETHVQYEATHDSIATHPLPEWYQDAKFGVIIHYGIYTIPAWAPIYNPVGKIFSNEFFINNPYPEWYANTMQIKKSPTYQYHLEHYGANFKYDDFAPLFNEELKKWNPDAWSKLFAKAGVKYVVFVTKHHDGFLLWNSQYRNPYKPNFVATRDVVAELTKSVRKQGLRMGLYYSGGYDWSWPSETAEPITDLETSMAKIPQSLAYSDYVFNQWNELIQKYKPDLLWNDIALPSQVKKWEIFSNYYNLMPEGVFNNRWGQGDGIDFAVLGQPFDFMIDIQRKQDWFDYYSPEYLPNYMLTKHKWEADHGIGFAFGYNREELLHPEHLRSLDQLIEDLADVVSKNGNLLLGIPVEADGTIPTYYHNLLEGIGQWLIINGEAIYKTKPWRNAEGKANGVISVRFTQSKDEKYLYIILLKNPQHNDVKFDGFSIPFKKIEVLDKHPIVVNAQNEEGNLTVYLSAAQTIPSEHPIVLRLEREYVN